MRHCSRTASHMVVPFLGERGERRRCIPRLPLPYCSADRRQCAIPGVSYGTRADLEQRAALPSCRTAPHIAAADADAASLMGLSWKHR